MIIKSYSSNKKLKAIHIYVLRLLLAYNYVQLLCTLTVIVAIMHHAALFDQQQNGGTYASQYQSNDTVNSVGSSRKKGQTGL